MDWLTKNVLRFDEDFQVLTIEQAYKLDMPLNEMLTNSLYKTISFSTTKAEWFTHTIECKLCKEKLQIPSYMNRTVVDVYIVSLETFIKCHWGCKTDLSGQLFNYKPCYSCHLDGKDEVRATKVLTFTSPMSYTIQDFNIDLCDPCYEFRSKQGMRKK